MESWGRDVEGRRERRRRIRSRSRDRSRKELKQNLELP